LDHKLVQQREKDKLKLEEKLDSLTNVVRERDEFKVLVSEMKLQNDMLKEEMENEITNMQEDHEEQIRELESKYFSEKEFLKGELQSSDKSRDELENAEILILSLKTQMRNSEKIFQEERRQFENALIEEKLKSQSLEEYKRLNEQLSATVKDMETRIVELELSFEKEPKLKQSFKKGGGTELKPSGTDSDSEEALEPEEEDSDEPEDNKKPKIPKLNFQNTGNEQSIRDSITINRLKIENEKIKKLNESSVETQKELVKKINQQNLENENLQNNLTKIESELKLLKEERQEKMSSQMLLEQMKELLSEEMKNKKKLETEMQEAKEKLNYEIQQQLEKEMELEYQREQIENERKEKEKEMNNYLVEEKKRLQIDKKNMEAELKMLEEERKNFQSEMKSLEEKKKEEKKKSSFSISLKKSSSATSDSTLSSNPITRKDSSTMYVTKLESTITKLEKSLNQEREQHEKEIGDLEFELRQVKSSREQLLKLIDTQLMSSNLPSPTPKKNLLKSQFGSYFSILSPGRNASSHDLNKPEAKKNEKKFYGVDLNDIMEREAQKNSIIPTFFRTILIYLEKKGL
jgi:hypothetical protein